MKKLVNILSILLLLALAVIGCANPGTTTTVGAVLGKQFTLSIGQTATIGTEKLDIKFKDIMQGSSYRVGLVPVY